jgi:hypothetical protein
MEILCNARLCNAKWGLWRGKGVGESFGGVGWVNGVEDVWRRGKMFV